MSLGFVAASLLLVEAALSLATARRSGERLAEAVAFFLLAAALSVLNTVELASELAGVEPHVFSLQLTERLGSEMLAEAEKTVSSALAWSQAVAIASATTFTILLAASVLVSGIPVVAASLAHAGLGLVQAVVNSALTVATVYRFVGQLYLVVAKAGKAVELLLPLGAALMVPKSTRKLGATLLSLCLGLSLALPAALNAAATMVKPWESELEVGELGLVEFEPLLSVPLARVRDAQQLDFSFEWVDVPAPPGLVVVYGGAAGRVAVRQAGRWFVERASQYRIAGAVYGIYWVPTRAEVFEVKAGVYANLSCRASLDRLAAPICIPEARNVTRVRFKVASENASLVLFSDSSGAQSRGWGLWMGKGFFVLEGSERRGSRLWWYNVEGYLENHEVVGVLDPSFCDSRKGVGRPPLELGLNGPAPNATVEYLEVTAWIEGDFDHEALCASGRPRIIEAGESVVIVNGTVKRLRPELWCEVSFVPLSLPDARDSLSLWFDQFARAVNASLPPSAEVVGSQRCLYGNGSRNYAIVWNGRVLYSQALWPKSAVRRVVVTARYYGNITKQAIVGPAPVLAEARSFTASLGLVGGFGECESYLTIQGYDTMNESVVFGLAYDSYLEDFLNGELARKVGESVRDILGCVSALTLVATSLLAAAIGVGMLSSVLGGTAAVLLPPLGPLRYPLLALREIGSALVYSAKSAVGALVFRGSQTRIAQGAFAEEAYNILRQIRREIEMLRKLPSKPETRREKLAKGAKRALELALSYSGSHPLPLTLRLASEAARRRALRMVPDVFPYDERLRIAFTLPVAARLLLASDVLYALSWILDAKLFTIPFAARFIKSVAKEYRLIYPKRLKLEDLLEGSKSRTKAELEKALSKLSRELLKGRVEEKDLKRASEVLAKSVLPSGVLELLEGGLKGSVSDLGWKVAALAAYLDIQRPEVLSLVSSKPAIALRLADLVALDRLSLSRSWKAAVFEGLSKLERGGVELASVWLSAVERGEGWRYLARRLASEPSVWFSPDLPAQVRELAKALAEASEGGSASVQKLLGESSSGREFEERLVRGFVEALKGLGVDLRTAVEAFVLSGDPYWAGYAVTLALESGSLDEFIRAFVEVSTRSGRFLESVYREEIAEAKEFLERAYRELAHALALVEESLISMPAPPIPLEPGRSLAMAAEAEAKASRERELLEDMLSRIDSALNVISALTAEANEVKLKVRVLEVTSPKEWYQSLAGLEKLLASARTELEDLKFQVRCALKLIKHT